MNSTEETASKTTPYEPPRIESILTQEDLQREALYAGAPSGLE